MAKVINFLTASSTLILNGEAILDFIEGDYITLSFPNPVSNRSNGEGNSVTVSKRVDSDVAILAVSVKKLSAADRFLNSKRFLEIIEVFQGSIKENYSADGVEGVESYLLENGTFTDQGDDTRNNQERGDVMVYTIEFRRVSRQP